MEFGKDNTEITRPSADGSEFDIFFSDAAGTRPEAETAETSAPKVLSDLSVCTTCHCEMVYPIDWARAESSQWRVTLRCPNCELVESGVFDEDLIERFDCLLDRGTDSLVRDLRNLTYANMATEISAFVEALRGDHLLPEDF